MLIISFFFLGKNKVKKILANFKQGMKFFNIIIQKEAVYN